MIENMGNDKSSILALIIVVNAIISSMDKNSRERLYMILKSQIDSFESDPDKYVKDTGTPRDIAEKKFDICRTYLKTIEITRE